MQNQRGAVFLGIAILLGLGAAFLVRERLADQGSGGHPVAETAPVVVARTDLEIASGLTDRQLETVAWPKAHLPKGALSRVEQARDRVLRRPLLQGEPVLESALLPEGAASGLSGVISPDHRAVSVKVDPVIGVAGFVKPGARVDVLVTLRRVDRPKAIPYSKVILQNVRVLAVDQKLEEVKNGDPALVNVVTLEVKPEQAEQLTYAAHEGRLQLALRNPTDQETVKTGSVGVADLLDADAYTYNACAREQTRTDMRQAWMHSAAICPPRHIPIPSPLSSTSL